MFLRGQHDFKIQLPSYFLEPDWLIRSFPSNLKNDFLPTLYLGFRWATVGIWFSGHRITNELELTNYQKIMEKYG